LPSAVLGDQVGGVLRPAVGVEDHTVDVAAGGHGRLQRVRAWNFAVSDASAFSGIAIAHHRALIPEPTC
jgi:hypothetical protein